MREYLSMMLVPVRTLLAGTAEPCCRKAWALTGGLGKVFAGRSNSGAEFILFFSTLLASTFRRQRKHTEFKKQAKALQTHWAGSVWAHGWLWARGWWLISYTIGARTCCFLQQLSRDYTLLGAGENNNHLKVEPFQISTLWDWLCPPGSEENTYFFINTFAVATMLNYELQIWIGLAIIRWRASKLTRSLPFFISALKAGCI